MVHHHVLPLKLMPLVYGQMGPRPTAHLGCLVGFRLDAPTKPLSFVELAALFAETPDGQAMDIAYAKPRGEFLVAGSAVAPGGTSVQGLDVHVRVGRKARTIRVYGDRWWRWSAADRGWVPTNPQPFTEMPLSWTRAFGGPGFEENPLGIGNDAMDRINAGALAPLPNLEDPRQPITEPRATYRPVSLGAVPPNWAPRRRRMGTLYDDRWLREEWPAFARDFDVDYFQAAQPEQWVDGFFEGDEDFEIRNMNADSPVQRGNLPGLRARCFMAAPAGDQPADADTLHELALRLETVWLLPTTGVCLMIYRSATEVPDSDLAHLRALMFGLEWQAQPPRPLSHYAEVYRLRMDPEEGYLHALNDQQLMPPLSEAEEAEKAAAQEEAKAAFKAQYEKMKATLAARLNAPLPADAQKQFATLEETTANLMKQAEAELAKAGRTLPPELAELSQKLPDASPQAGSVLSHPAFAKLDAAVDALPMISQHDVATMNIDAAGLARGMDAITEAMDEAFALLEPDADAGTNPLEGVDPRDPKGAMLKMVPAEQQGDVQKAFDDAAKASADAGKPDPFAPKPPDALLADHKAWVDHRVFGPLPDGAAPKTPEELLEPGSVEGPTLPDFDELMKGVGIEGTPPAPADNAEAQARAEALEEADRALAERIEAAMPEGPKGPVVAGPLLEAARPYLGEQAERAAREGHSLAFRDLSEGDYTGRDLSGADLAGAGLGDAVLSATRLRDAKLDGAAIQRARLARADLTGASLTAAVIEDSDLSGAEGAGADLSDAVFNGVRAGAPEEDSTGDGSKAPEAPDPVPEPLPGTGATGGAPLRLAGARAKGAVFIKCALPGVDFSGADLNDVTFVECDLTGARFTDAGLEACCFMQCTMPSADFSRARLSNTAFIRSRLASGVLSGANLSGVTAFECDMAGVTAVDLTAENTAFLTVAADGIILSRAKLTRFMGMKESTFRGARIDAVEAWQCSFRGSDLSGADLSLSRFTQCDFGSAVMRGAKCERALMKHAMLADAVLEAASFRAANLMDALMRKANARGADFEEAELYAAQPMEGDFTDARFAGAGTALFDLDKAVRDRR